MGTAATLVFWGSVPSRESGDTDTNREVSVGLGVALVSDRGAKDSVVGQSSANADTSADDKG